MRALYILMVAMHWFVGLGAVGGGLGAVLNPDAPMGLPKDVLKYGPFHNFLIPGLFLLIVIGVGNVVSGIFVFKRSRYHEAISALMGAMLVAWIVIQCAVLWAINPLHVIFFGIGIAQVFLGLFLSMKNRVFPSTLIGEFFNRKHSS